VKNKSDGVSLKANLTVETENQVKVQEKLFRGKDAGHYKKVKISDTVMDDTVLTELERLRKELPVHMVQELNTPLACINDR